MPEIHNPQKKDKIKTIEWLIENFPAAFFKHPSAVKPLKIGIFDDIIEFYDRLDSPPFSKKAIRDAIHYYSNSPAYLKCQKEDAARIDLFGNEIDIVSKDQAKYAYLKFQKKYKK